MLKNTSLAAAFSAITLCSVSICNAEEILKPEVGTEENIVIEKKEVLVPCCQVNPDTKIFKNLFGLRSLFNKTSSIFGGKGAGKLDLTDPNSPNLANKVDANGIPIGPIGTGTGGRDTGGGYARNSNVNMFGDAFLGGSASSRSTGPSVNVRTIGGTLLYPNGTIAPFSLTSIPSNGVATSGQISTLSLQTTNLTQGTGGLNTNSFVVPTTTVTFTTPGSPTPVTGQYLVYTGKGGTPITTNTTTNIDNLNSNAFVTSIVDKSLLPGEKIGSQTNTYNSADGNVNSIYFITMPQNLDIEVPAAGGTVGRVKVSDDNNPLPRDRLIFNFDYFNNVPLIQDGFNVFRYNFGFEKTFLDQRASIQMLFPVASTVDSTNLTTGGAGEAAIGSRSVQFGNMSIILKYLFGSNEKGAIAGGLGFSLPTAPGTNLYDLQGNKLIELQNQSLTLSPYIAALYTPTENLYTQAWIATNFDASGSPVKGFPTSDSAFQNVGRFNNTSVLQVDAQIGYWIINPDYSMRRNLRGLAPFIELHYNGSMGDYDVVQSGNFNIRDPLGRYDEFNISAGFNTQIRDDLNILFGAVAPLSSNTNRHFDYQLGVHVNYFFGATSKANKSNVVRNLNSF